MPFTPYHLGPGFFIGLLFLSFIDFPTFLIASVIVDIEPFFVIFFNLNYPLHGFFHSFLGGPIIALNLALIMTQIRKFFTPILSSLKIEQEISYKKILFASFLGIYIHILLDSPLYRDIKPFFPFNYNPFYVDSNITGLIITQICVWCFIGAIALYAIKLIIVQVKNRKNEYESDKKVKNNLEETDI